MLGPGAATEGEQVHIDVWLVQEKLQQFWVIPVRSNPQSWLVGCQFITDLLPPVLFDLISFYLLIRC